VAAGETLIAAVGRPRRVFVVGAQRRHSTVGERCRIDSPNHKGHEGHKDHWPGPYIPGDPLYDPVPGASVSWSGQDMTLNGAEEIGKAGAPVIQVNRKRDLDISGESERTARRGPTEGGRDNSRPWPFFVAQIFSSPRAST
jgi:hypothetical protein